jgi:hypothetical protein
MRAFFGLAALIGLSTLAATRVMADPCANPPINSVAVSDVQVTSGMFVVDADAALGPGWNKRDSLQVQTEVDIVYNSGDPQPHRLRLELLDQNNSAVPLAGGDVFVTFTVDGNSPAQLVSTTALDPTSALDPKTLYRVRATLEKEEYLCVDSAQVGSFWTPVNGQSLDSPASNYLHFTNTVSGDVELNALACISSIDLQRNVALPSANPLSKFPVEVTYDLYRYDAFDAAPTLASVPLRLTLELRNGSDAVVPLAQSVFLHAQDLSSHGLGIFPDPLEVTQAMAQTHTFEFDPTSMPDLLDAGHRLAVTLEVAETPAATNWRSASTVELTSVRLVELNGTLYFGMAGDGVGAVDISTTIGNLANPQTISGSNQMGFFETSLAGVEFTVDADPSLGSGPAALDLSIAPDGTAWIGPTAIVNLVATGSFRRSFGSLEGFLKNANGDPGVTLSASGGTGSLDLLLPAGMGWSASSSGQRVNPLLNFSGLTFDDSLTPTMASLTSSSGPFWITVEDVPVRMQAPNITWNLATDSLQFSPGSVVPVRAPEYAALESVPAPHDPELIIPVSNDLHYRFCSSATPVTVRARATDGAAELNGTFNIGAGSFHAHFPRYASIAWTMSGSVAWTDGDINPTTSALNGVEPTLVGYQVSCSDKACLGQLPEYRYAAVTPTGNSLRFTADGGLWGEGAFSSAPQVNPFFNFGSPIMPEARFEWGFRTTTGDFANKATQLVDPVFAMTGSWLDAEATPLASRQWPGVIHLSGFGDPATSAATERPGAAGYTDGLLNYAGVSAQSDGTSSQGESFVGDVSSGPYDLAAESRYYARSSGVTGVHKASSFPSSLAVYGYAFGFTQFGASYRDTQMLLSSIKGSLSLPFPTGLNLPFDSLSLTCVGDVDQLGVPTSSSSVRLAHWAADMKILSAVMDE